VKNETLVFHRKGVTNQTMNFKGSLGARAARWATCMLHVEGVGAELSKRENVPSALWRTFFNKLGKEYLFARRKVRVHNGKYGAKLNSTAMMLIERFLPMSRLSRDDVLNANKHLADLFANTIKENVALSIVIPVHKVPLDLEQKMQDMFRNIKLKFEVFFVYDRIDDNGIELLQTQARAHDNVFVFESGAPNAGRARNTAYPLLLGEFTYFFDADDSIDFVALDQAVREAQSQGSEVLMLRYNISTPQPSGQTAVKGMLGGDVAIWNAMMDRARNATQDLAATQQRNKMSAIGLINYPWKQLTQTMLLREKAVYFGPNSVHNDVQFHWHSLAVANRVDFSKGSPVCTHLKSGIAGASLTEVRSTSRLEVFDALKWTGRVLHREGFLNLPMQNHSLGLHPESSEQTDNRKIWFRFVKNILHWNEGRVPPEALVELKRRRKQLFSSMGVK
jgi:glycosyltransferase involved in cell wall biosynthesis